jgi:hypothetical protein
MQKSSVLIVNIPWAKRVENLIYLITRDYSE